MRNEWNRRALLGSYRRATATTRLMPSEQPETNERSVLTILGVTGSVASDDGHIARIRVQTPHGETELEFARSGLTSLQAAIALAQQRCEENSISDRRLHFAHYAQALAIDETSDPDMVLMTFTLDAGQRMSFFIRRGCL